MRNSCCCRLPPISSLLLLAAGAPLLVSSQRYDVDASLVRLVSRRRTQVYAEADACTAELGTALGVPFLDCVLGRLTEAQERTTKKESGDGGGGGERDDDPFPVPPFTRNPLTIQESYGYDDDDDDDYDPANHPRMLMDLLRNYTCGRDVDGGSPVVEEVEWVYDEAKVMAEQDEADQSCPSDLGGVDADKNKWQIAGGYLPDGHDIGHPRRMDIGAAKEHCDSLPKCEGFTFETTDDTYGGAADGPPPTIYFKGRATVRDVQVDDEWVSYVRKRIPARCRAAAEDGASTTSNDVEYAPPHEYKIEVLRREPLVAVIPEFASVEECDMLIQAGGSFDDMSRAFEAGGPTSYRRSYSSNINVNYDDRSAPLTRFAERMFAFVRHVTGYDLRGPGQEPINAVLYKNAGDEYRPHCDGSCDGQRYRYGERVATSILYCQTPEGGGQTSFTRSGMMVSPRPRDLLLFAYKHDNGTMDTGFTEHSGCPIAGGRKWIATQWYREAVTYDHPWEAYDEDRRAAWLGTRDDDDEADYDDDEEEEEEE